MTPEQLKTYPEYQKLSPLKQSFLMEIVRDSAGLGSDGALPLLLKSQARMKALGIQFTKEESSFLTTVLLSDLPTADRAKFELLRKMMKN